MCRAQPNMQQEADRIGLLQTCSSELLNLPRQQDLQRMIEKSNLGCINANIPKNVVNSSQLDEICLFVRP